MARAKDRRSDTAPATSEERIGLDTEAIRARLVERERTLFELRDALELRSRTDPGGATGAGELSSYDQHFADMGSETFERAKEISIMTGLDEQLSDVADARRRLDEGRYGLCAVCGQAIEPERLEAMPESRYCLRDRRRAEREAGEPA